MIIDGNKIAEKIRSELKEKIERTSSAKRPPGLAFILVGNNPASHSYVQMKQKRCKEIGIFSEDYKLDESASQEKVLEILDQLNHADHIDGILLQLPLPSHMDVDKITNSINPEKDVDGFHPSNMGKLLLGQEDGFLPCTPKGILRLLSDSKVPVAGKHVVVIGRSNIVGKPLAAMLMQKKEHANATVTIANSYTKNLKEICKSADIVIAAIGKPHFVTEDMIQKGSVVIDVGVNKIKPSLPPVGDVDYERVAPLCSYITKVPGGVGPMTIAMLLENTWISYSKRHHML